METQKQPLIDSHDKRACSQHGAYNSIFKSTDQANLDCLEKLPGLKKKIIISSLANCIAVKPVTGMQNEIKSMFVSPCTTPT